MEIKGPSLPPLPLDNLKPLPSSWRIGQQLQAIVIRATVNQIAVLQIGKQQLQAQTPLQLQAGLKLTVEVVKLGSQPTLLIKTALPAPDATLNNSLKILLPRQTSITPLLANVALLNQSTQQAALNALPASIQTSLKQLFQQIPSRDKITTATGLKQAVKDSGLFMENKLLNSSKPQLTQSLPLTTQRALTTTSTQADFKANIQRLVAATVAETRKIDAPSAAAPRPTGESGFKLGLMRMFSAILPQSARPATSATQSSTAPLPTAAQLGPLQAAVAPHLAPPMTTRSKPEARSQPTLQMQLNTLVILQELVKQSEGALARLQLNQLASLPGNEQQLPNLALELPVRNGDQVDLLQLRIDEEESQGEHDEDEQDKRWSISLSLNLDNVGPIHARVSQQGDRVSTTLWAEEPDTLNLINAHLKELATRMREAGITLDEINCYPGAPNLPSDNLNPHIVLDVNA